MRFKLRDALLAPVFLLPICKAAFLNQPAFVFLDFFAG